MTRTAKAITALLACLVAGGPAVALAGGEDAKPLSLDAKPTAIPYRSIVSGTPVPGARRMPAPPPRRPVGPGWLQRTLNQPAPERPEPSEPLPSDKPHSRITARTIPPEPPRPAPLSDEEIIVWGDRLERARADVVRRLTDLGYAPGGMRNGRTTWKPTSAADSWKPRVIVDDDGWFELETPTVSGGRGTLDNAAMQPGVNNEGPAFDYAPPMAAPGVGGSFAGKRVRQAAEARVVRQVWDVVHGLALAHEEEALIDRLEHLPDELDALWYEGRGPDGTWYPSVADRQEALLLLWSSRTRTRAGETVRARIADYLMVVVDPEARLDENLVETAQLRCGCVLFPDEDHVQRY